MCIVTPRCVCVCLLNWGPEQGGIGRGHAWRRSSPSSGMDHKDWKRAACSSNESDHGVHDYWEVTKKKSGVTMMEKNGRVTIARDILPSIPVRGPHPHLGRHLVQSHGAQRPVAAVRQPRPGPWASHCTAMPAKLRLGNKNQKLIVLCFLKKYKIGLFCDQFHIQNGLWKKFPIFSRGFI